MGDWEGGFQVAASICLEASGLGGHITVVLGLFRDIRQELAASLEFYWAVLALGGLLGFLWARLPGLGVLLWSLGCYRMGRLGYLIAFFGLLWVLGFSGGSSEGVVESSKYLGVFCGDLDT
jgi:hypothetical protein